MKETIIPPNVSSLIKSLRDVGYTTDAAISDLVDNSISANAKNINIRFIPLDDSPVVSILDDGAGMDIRDLVEAMRLATKDPSDIRAESDLGRFGLGLKTASFSQCKLLTVISKTKTSGSNATQWDLDKVIYTNQWVLNQLDLSELPKGMPLLDEFNNLESGTLVHWSKMDKTHTSEIASKVSEVSNHMSLVFNRFLSGEGDTRQISIKLNNIDLDPFDPLDKKNPETLFEESITVENHNKKVHMQACILPSAVKTTKSAFERNATINGYLRSQGSYLYRADRLIAYGTWWNIIKRHDSHNLVRVQIDIGNDQDEKWNITVTKSGFSVSPPVGIKNDLRAVIKSATKVGRGVAGGRKRIVKNKTRIMLWSLVKYDNDEKYGYSINKSHPLYMELVNSIDTSKSQLLNVYLNELQKYLPVDDINRSLIHTPHDFDQKNSSITDNDEREIVMIDFIKKLEEKGYSKEDIGNMLMSEGLGEFLK